MSERTSRRQNHPTALHGSAPIREGIALRGKNGISCSTRRRKIGSICLRTGRLCDIAARLTGLNATASPSAALQIPIARSPL